MISVTSSPCCSQCQVQTGKVGHWSTAPLLYLALTRSLFGMVFLQFWLYAWWVFKPGITYDNVPNLLADIRTCNKTSSKAFLEFLGKCKSVRSHAKVILKMCGAWLETRCRVPFPMFDRRQYKRTKQLASINFCCDLAIYSWKRKVAVVNRSRRGLPNLLTAEPAS